MSRSDGESSLSALKNAVRDANPRCGDDFPRTSPVGEHAANAETENAVKEVKRQVRVLKSSL